MATYLAPCSITDELTCINNRRGFKNDTNNLIRLAARNNLSLSLIYFDINNLKEANDTHGHTAGDFLIKSFSEALSSTIRSEDIIARLGGDEFCFLGVHKNNDEPIGLKSRIQIKFDALVKGDKRFIRPSFSSGSKLFTQPDEFNIEDMLSEVDGLMYMKKHHTKICL